MRARDAEIDGVEQRLLHRSIGKQRERVAGDGAVMASALDRIFQCAMAAHDRDGLVEIGGLDLALLKHPFPEQALIG